MSTEDNGREGLRAAQVRIPGHVVHREFPSETVVLNLQTERYHGLNPTAGKMLVALEQSGSVEEAATAVAKAFERPRDEVLADLCALCQRLADRGIIEIVGDQDG